MLPVYVFSGGLQLLLIVMHFHFQQCLSFFVVCRCSLLSVGTECGHGGTGNNAESVCVVEAVSSVCLNTRQSVFSTVLLCSDKTAAAT